MLSRRVRLLAAAIFTRFFETEVFSSSVSASSAVTWLLAATATPGAVVSMQQYYVYAHARAFSPDRLDRIVFVSQVVHVAFAMGVAGLLAMLVWTSVLPDRRDALVLGPLPVTLREQALARLLALGRLIGLFATAVAIPAAIVFTFVTADHSGAQVAVRISGHVLATWSAAVFVFLIAIDLHMVLVLTLGAVAVRLATLCLQFLALVGLVAAMSSATQLADVLLTEQSTTLAAVSLNPTAWFVGAYRWTAGDARPAFAALAEKAVWAIVCAVAGAAVLFPLAVRRALSRSITDLGGPDVVVRPISFHVTRAMARGLLARPFARGLASFVCATLFRGHTHRFIVGSYVSAGGLFALPQLSRLLESPEVPTSTYAWFAAPLGLACWVSAGIRVAMLLPIEPQARWLFQLLEPAKAAAQVATSTAFAIRLLAVAPLTVAFGAAAAASASVALGAAVAAVTFIAGNVLAELLVLGPQSVPFACTYRPGRLKLRAMWPVYGAVWIAMAFVLPHAAAPAVGNWARLTTIVFGLAALWLGLRARRLVKSRAETPLMFDDDEPTIPSLEPLWVHTGDAGATR